MAIMMKCGCAANAKRVMPDGSRAPSCLIHDCIEVDDAPVDVSARRARCTYFGLSCRPMGDRGGAECDDCRKTLRCKCECQSSSDLAFFKHQPAKPFDEFYCGCKGWD